MTVLEWLQLRKQEISGNALSRSDTAEGRRLAQAELARRRKLRWPNPLKTIRRCREEPILIRFCLIIFQ
jgi:hypothetical protein